MPTPDPSLHPVGCRVPEEDADARASPSPLFGVIASRALMGREPTDFVPPREGDNIAA